MGRYRSVSPPARCPLTASSLSSPPTSADGPWEPLETSQDIVDGTIEATTTHFSFFTAIFAPFVDIVKEAKKIFDDATGGFAADAEQLTCQAEPDARLRVQITSSNSDAIKWCLGVEGGTTILRVANNRRYSLQASHPGLTVVDAGFDPTSIAAWAAKLDNTYALLSPRRAVTFSVDGATAGMNTEFNGVADSLYQLQLGVETLIAILGRFGITADKNVALTLAGAPGCAATIGDPTGGNIIANCFSPGDILRAFGPKAVFAAAFMAIGPLIEFFHSRFNALGDLISHRDQYSIAITPVVVPADTSVVVTDPPADDGTCPDVTGFNDHGDNATGITMFGTGIDCGYVTMLIFDLGAQHHPWEDSPVIVLDGVACAFTELPSHEGDAGRYGSYGCEGGGYGVFFDFYSGE